MRRKHFRLKRIALGLAFAAVVVPTAQAKPVPLTPAPQQPIASEISVQSPVSQLTQETKRWLAMAKATDNLQAYTPVARRPVASEISVQSPVSQLAVEGLRYQAMARAYENRPGITAAGAALSNARHSAYSVPVTQTQAAAGSDGFNWSDAGVGASVTFGAALMLLMAVVLGRRARSRPTGLAST